MFEYQLGDQTVLYTWDDHDMISVEAVVTCENPY